MAISDYDIDLLTEKVSSLTTNEVDDEVIEDCLENALTFAEVQCGVEILPTKIQYTVVSVVLEYLERRGHEGISSRTELSTSTSYVYKDIQDSLRSKLKGHRHPNTLIGK